MFKQKQKVYFKTFGCRTNQFDTQIMMQSLQNYEVTLQEDHAHIIVINSCTVTNGADSSVRNYINSVKRRSNAKIVFAGCGAFSQGGTLFEQNRVHTVFGHSQKKDIDTILQKKDPHFSLGSLDAVDDLIVANFIGKSRCFIKIQEGCDFRCSYCIIPSVRGGSRSHDEGMVLKQIKLLAQNGYGEFILTGTNVGSYGKDTQSSLARLLQKIVLIPGVKRVRLGSIEPSQVDEALIDIVSHPKIAKHLHIAIQHSSNAMLSIMQRQNRFESDLKLLQRFAKMGFALGTDFIVGHPHESQDIWEEAVANISQMPLTHIHAFTYSKRDNTLSAKMGETVPNKVAKLRHKQLVQIIKEKNYRFRSAVSQPLFVLVENSKNGVQYGYDQFYNQIKIKSDKDLQHCWIEVDNVKTEKDGNVTTI